MGLFPTPRIGGPRSANKDKQLTLCKVCKEGIYPQHQRVWCRGRLAEQGHTRPVNGLVHIWCADAHPTLTRVGAPSIGGEVKRYGPDRGD